MSKTDKRKRNWKINPFFLVYLMHLLTACAEAASLFCQVTHLPMAFAGPPHRDKEEKKVKQESQLHTKQGSDKTSSIGSIRATINF